MLRLRNFSTGLKPFQRHSKTIIRQFELEEKDLQLDSLKTLSTDATSLPFAHRRHGETFGQLVRDQNYDLEPTAEGGVNVISQEEVSQYRDPESGELLSGANAKEARLNKDTLIGRMNRDQIKVPDIISKTINQHILLLNEPSKLRKKAAEYYIALNESGVHSAPQEKIDVDTHIASCFLQNYASVYQALCELQKRINFNPQRILEIGYGPATGIVALNELMGPDFNPETKEAVISSYDMEKRAKIILSRQHAEYTGEYTEDANEKEDSKEGKDNVGPISTKQISLKTKLLKQIPSNQYDLIIVTHQLLTSKDNFPDQIDHRLHEYLQRLSPGGHLVLLERGTPLGFETIARARQVAIRPEDLSSLDKAPVTYTKGKESIPLRIVAPCQHHGKCPLQVGNPEYYGYGKIGKKLTHCHFQATVMRPKFTMELKKGSVLATPWTDQSSGIGIKGMAKAGSGRPNGRDYETANFSYLILGRDSDYVPQDVDSWPRVMRTPLKKKKLVTAEVCASSGEIETWNIPRSLGKQVYHDARKLRGGDLWPLGAKTTAKARSSNSNYMEKLEEKEKTLRSIADKEMRKVNKEQRRELRQALSREPETLEEKLDQITLQAMHQHDERNKNRRSDEFKYRY